MLLEHHFTCQDAGAMFSWMVDSMRNCAHEGAVTRALDVPLPDP